MTEKCVSASFPHEFKLIGKELVALKCVKKLFKILFAVVSILFVVYFWNLDQKVLGWAYKQVNLMFDQKKVDQVF